MSELHADVLEIVKLRPSAQLPLRAYNESAAFDLSADLIDSKGREATASIAPGTTKLIPTGLAIRPPPGHVILICSRSGYAVEGVFVANAPGIVDPNYTGEIKVILINGGYRPFFVKHGERVGQALLVPFSAPAIREVKSLPETERGANGFGSSGR